MMGIIVVVIDDSFFSFYDCFFKLGCKLFDYKYKSFILDIKVNPFAGWVVKFKAKSYKFVC